jgi:hypothetical protein
MFLRVLPTPRSPRYGPRCAQWFCQVDPLKIMCSFLTCQGICVLTPPCIGGCLRRWGLVTLRASLIIAYYSGIDWVLNRLDHRYAWLVSTVQL